ncbi:MAG TPA: acyl carrier protein [Chloroflexota bacterium]
MIATEAQILAEVLELLGELADDWEFSGPIRPETRFLSDLGLESLDLVVIGTSLQQRYGRLPFSEFLAEIGQRPIEERDVTVSELLAFVCQHHTGRPQRGT